MPMPLQMRPEIFSLIIGQLVRHDLPVSSPYLSETVIALDVPLCQLQY